MNKSNTGHLSNQIIAPSRNLTPKPVVWGVNFPWFQGKSRLVWAGSMELMGHIYRYLWNRELLDIKHDGLGKVDPLYAGESNMARGGCPLVQIRSVHLQRNPNFTAGTLPLKLTWKPSKGWHCKKEIGSSYTHPIFRCELAVGFREGILITKGCPGQKTQGCRP